MNLSHRLPQWRLGVAALALILVALGAQPARADEPVLGPKKAEEVQKLNQLAQDLEKNKTNVANWLRSLVGFAPELDGFPLDAHAYFDLPDTIKLRAAYEARENAEADSGAVLLNLMVKRLELEVLQKKSPELSEEDRKTGRKLAEEIIALFEKLNPKFKLNDEQTQLVKFVFMPAPERPKLSDEDRKRVAVLVQYLEQSRNGGPIAALKRYFDIDTDAAYALIWESGTVQRTFERALARKVEKEPEYLQTVIKRANEDALKNKDRSLENTAILWAKPKKKQPGDDDLPPVTPERAAKISDPPKAALTPEKRADIYREDLEKAPSLKVAEVRKRADNPTGIFFASETRVDPALPKPTSLEYTPGADPASGKLTITFADNSKRTLGPVSAEEAWMAFEMANGTGAIKPGDGVQLLVLDGPHSHYEIKDGKLVGARRREVIVHPALLGRDLGLACIRIDGMPRTRQWLLDEIDADPTWARFEKEEAARRRQVLNQTADWVFDPWTNLGRKYGAHSSVFRVTDVPLYLHGGEGVLVVERDDPDGRFSEPLCRRTFIEADVIIQKYTAKGTAVPGVKRPENYQAEAYKLMAELVPASAELQRLNNFAAVLGVVRWAKSNEAKFAAPAKPKDGPRTPEAVAMYNDRIVPLAGGTKEEILKQETDKLDTYLNKLSSNDKVKQFQDLCEKLLKTNDEAKREKLAQQADDLARTAPEVRLLEDLVEAKYVEILSIGRKTLPKDDKKTDFAAETERMEELQEKLDGLKDNSPAEYLIAQNLLLKYLQRLKEQSKVD